MKGKAVNYQYCYLPAVGSSRACVLLVLTQQEAPDQRLFDLLVGLIPSSVTLLVYKLNLTSDGRPTSHRPNRRRDPKAAERHAHELADFLSLAADDYGFDSGAVIAIGVHSGAALATALLLLRCWELRSVILFRPLLPLIPGTPPFLTHKTALMIADRGDPAAPTNDVEQLAAIFREGGAAVDLAWCQGDPSSDDLMLECARTWLRRTLAAESGGAGVPAH